MKKKNWKKTTTIFKNQKLNGTHSDFHWLLQELLGSGRMRCTSIVIKGSGCFTHIPNTTIDINS